VSQEDGIIIDDPTFEKIQNFVNSEYGYSITKSEVSLETRNGAYLWVVNINETTIEVSHDGTGLFSPPIVINGLMLGLGVGLIVIILIIWKMTHGKE
jgi:hypothetical protein